VRKEVREFEREPFFGESAINVGCVHGVPTQRQGDAGRGGRGVKKSGEKCFEKKVLFARFLCHGGAKLRRLLLLISATVVFKIESQTPQNIGGVFVIFIRLCQTILELSAISNLKRSLKRRLRCRS
jgi:hypothetical protein